MPNLTVFAPALPHMPWEEPLPGSHPLLFRSAHNPLLGPGSIPCASFIHNSAVVPYGDGFAGVFRVDNRSRRMQLHAGRSRDGLAWELDPEPIVWKSGTSEAHRFVYGYDPRLVHLEGRVYVTWCNGYHGPTIGLGVTDDFVTWNQLENALLPYNRNGVLFPRRIGGSYALLSRPSDAGHTPFGDIFVSFSPDLVHWGRHRHVMAPVREENGWQSTKIGAGPVPIETSEGWLLIYHGVVTTCNGFVYSAGAALLDLDQPHRVIARTDPCILCPTVLYETVGNVPNVVFPCAALVDGPTGRLALYYGSADTSVSVCYGYVSQLVDFVRSHSLKCS